MKFLRLAIDRDARVTLAVLQEGDSVQMYRREGEKNSLAKQYESVTSALKAFDNQVVQDYKWMGVYYSDFTEE